MIMGYVYTGGLPIGGSPWRSWLAGGHPNLFLFDDKYLGFVRSWFSFSYRSVIPIRGDGLLVTKIFEETGLTGG